jgi:hypothetical protein
VDLVDLGGAEHLYLDCSKVAPGALDDTFKSLKRIRHPLELTCVNNNLADSHLKNLPNGVDLRRLTIDRNKGITDVSLPLIERFSSLTVLSISETSITGNGIRDFSRRRPLEEVRVNGLGLSENDLAAIKDWPGLSHLAAAGSSISNEFVKDLCRRGTIAQLDLSDTKVDKRVLDELQWLPHLIHLRIAGVACDLSSIMQLARCKDLRLLDVSRTGVDAKLLMDSILGSRLLDSRNFLGLDKLVVSGDSDLKMHRLTDYVTVEVVTDK